MRDSGCWREEPPSHRPMITVKQLNALADAVGDRWRCLVEMAAWCGLRFGELAALRKNHIDIQGGTVTVIESAATLSGGVRHVGPPKSDAGRREVAIPPHILPNVINHLERFSEPRPDGLSSWDREAASCPRPISVLMFGGRPSRPSA